MTVRTWLFHLRHIMCDCAIDLLPREPLPTSLLYTFSSRAGESMEEYIKNSPAAGIIRPSSSPVLFFPRD